MTNDYMQGAADRATFLMDVRDLLATANNEATAASEKSHAAWSGYTDAFYKRKPAQIDAIRTMLDLVTDNVIDDINAAVAQVATLLVRDHIVPAARDSVEPVCFITGNSMMPPIREFDVANQIYQDDEHGDVWEHFHEALDEALNQHKVLMASPDYDNCLYVVDLIRWQYNPDAAESSDGDSLNDGWEEAPF